MEYLELKKVNMIYRSDGGTTSEIYKCNLTVFKNTDNYAAYIRVKEKKLKSAMEKWGPTMSSAVIFAGKMGIALIGHSITGKVSPISLRSGRIAEDNLRSRIYEAHKYVNKDLGGPGHEEIIFGFDRSKVFFEDGNANGGFYSVGKRIASFMKIADTYSNTSYYFFNNTQEELNEWKAFFNKNSIYINCHS